MSTTITDADRALAEALYECIEVSRDGIYQEFDFEKAEQLIAHHREEAVRALEADKKRLDWFERKTAERTCMTLFGAPKTGLMSDNEFRCHVNGSGYMPAATTIRAAIDTAMKASP